MKCLQCGTLVLEGTRFCGQCGMKVTDPEAGTMVLDLEEADELLARVRRVFRGEYDVGVRSRVAAWRSCSGDRDRAAAAHRAEGAAPRHRAERGRGRAVQAGSTDRRVTRPPEHHPGVQDRPGGGDLSHRDEVRRGSIARYHFGNAGRPARARDPDRVTGRRARTPPSRTDAASSIAS